MFCQHCGSAVDENVRFCTACGKPLPPSAATVPVQTPTQKMASHVKIMGVLWVVYSIFGILAGLWTLAISHFVMPIITNAVSQQGDVSIPASLPSFLQAIYIFAFGYSLATGVMGIVAAWGLLARTSWGRTAAIVIAIISVLSFPFGTALGIYTMVILMSSGADQTYRSIAVPA